MKYIETYEARGIKMSEDAKNIALAKRNRSKELKIKLEDAFSKYFKKFGLDSYKKKYHNNRIFFGEKRYMEIFKRGCFEIYWYDPDIRENIMFNIFKDWMIRKDMLKEVFNFRYTTKNSMWKYGTFSYVLSVHADDMERFIDLIEELTNSEELDLELATNKYNL